MTAGQGSTKIHITGAACSGVSTLGAALSDSLSLPLIDIDDYFWLPAEVPFSSKRPVGERVELIRAAQGKTGWVLAGSLDGWGDALVEKADLIVFLTAPTPVRLARLKRREIARFGPRIGPGGDMETIHSGFLDWAARYDEPGFIGRSRARHEAWLEDQSARILRLPGTRPVESLTEEVLTALARA